MNYMTTEMMQGEDKGWQKKAAFFLASQNISLFGSAVVGFAITWHITLETSSGLWLTMSALCSMLPQVVVSLWGGVLADRYDRRLLIMLSDGFIALATLALAVVFLLGWQRLELLLAVSVVRSLAAGVQGPAVNAIFPQIVPLDKLTRVQGINQTVNSVLLLAAPAMGGLVLAFFGIVWTMFVDVATAAVAVAVLGRIHVERVARAGGTSMLEELRAGVVYTWGHALLKRVVVCFSFSFFLITPAAILTPLMLERSFDGGVWELTANELVWTAGSLLGGLYVSAKGGFKDKVLVIASCLVVFGVTFALLGLVSSLELYLLIMGVSGFFLPVIVTAQTVLLQENTEEAMMGRVFSIVQIITASAMPVGIIFFGPLADVVSVESILVVSGVLLVCVGVIYQWEDRRRAAE